MKDLVPSVAMIAWKVFNSSTREGKVPTRYQVTTVTEVASQFCISVKRNLGQEICFVFWEDRENLPDSLEKASRTILDARAIVSLS